MSQTLESFSPNDGSLIGRVPLATSDDYERAVAAAAAAFQRWSLVPAPQRGLIVREIAEELRRDKTRLGELVTREVGKIRAEAEGEVQEMIDIADFAVGLSRQLYGLTMHSERPGHRMYEQWHPLGVIGVITAFNFPVAVWAWNGLLAAMCGNCTIWKPAPQAPMCALAVQEICDRVMAKHGFAAVFQTLVGDVETVGARMLDDRRLPLISATGSTRMGRIVAERVGRRLGRTLLELGGNNGVIVMPEADIEMVTRSCVFGAVGTAGQRCTSLRRLFLHRSIAGEVKARLLAAYPNLPIGNPALPATLVGPLISTEAVAAMQRALSTIREQGGRVIYGGEHIEGCYVRPALVEAPAGLPMMQDEVFAPILYLVEFDSLEEAITLHNGVPQGLSSAIFTRDLQSAETFLSHRGSDCGIANVNIGTSGAEIGGAFGGEKDTGGGRESGSDSWRAYMRRQTVTINWSKGLPLAQGIEFPV